MIREKIEQSSVSSRYRFLAISHPDIRELMLAWKSAKIILSVYSS
ncbi:hypothetical protein LEP1GSC047_4282 [Leptospira inadai serovar Lyme str. 10]|uniref:Uncharacterized protein n=1 Tax=Leptospira inadai serovar Lyme str. 10 TaxID=1049790 RepID=V6HCP8_9LEPT|nr:hypothetical protein [Leptospira inadai]EQA37721.1 hypothetical protein LEP1GSC047_4282 [Leptospira inadai serovar Lyme str. 10]